MVSTDLVDLWSHYVEVWSSTAAEADADGEPFRWSEQMEPEVGEFLLHGLDRWLHSRYRQQTATPAESEAHKDFTMTVVRAFLDGLSTEGKASSHYIDQVLVSFNNELET